MQTNAVTLSGNIGVTTSLATFSIPVGNVASFSASVGTVTATNINIAIPTSYATTGTLNMSATGGITFGSTLNAPVTGNLQLAAGTNNISFGGNIGASSALGNLVISSAGTTVFGGSVATVTLSSLNIASAATFAAATTTITASGVNGITFGGNLNGTSVLNLSATTTASITFGGNIGNTATFSQFNINQAGTINFTSGTHTVNVNNWLIGASSTLIPTVLQGTGATTITSAGTITFWGRIDGSQNLTLNATNNVQLNDDIGVTTPLNTLTVGTGTLLSFGASVATVTVGTLNITGTIPTTFAATTTTVTTTGTGGITFNGNLNPEADNVTTLNLSAVGPITFGSNIGNPATFFTALNINAASVVNFTTGTHTADVNSWVIGAIPTVLQGTGSTIIQQRWCD